MNFLNRYRWFLIFFCLLFSATVSGAEETSPAYPSNQNKQLQNQIDDLNNQLDIREMEADGLKSAIKDQQEQIDDLKSAPLGGAETKPTNNKIHLISMPYFFA
ncbi:MAG: hypothetical protein WA081_05960 [Desulfosalsimonadaceae bacterium]